MLNVLAARLDDFLLKYSFLCDDIFMRARKSSRAQGFCQAGTCWKEDAGE